ncbi:MAG: hypothetical protein J6U15_08470 [Lachnospiraceae bacterium]|nr:hypothetical protein [Lachnospiraceae bacterium]
MGKMPEITFPPEAEEMAVKLAAFDIMKQLFKEGMITEAELMYLAEKHEIPIDID